MLTKGNINFLILLYKKALSIQIIINIKVYFN